MIFINLSS